MKLGHRNRSKFKSSGIRAHVVCGRMGKQKVLVRRGKLEEKAAAGVDLGRLAELRVVADNGTLRADSNFFLPSPIISPLSD